MDTVALLYTAHVMNLLLSFLLILAVAEGTVPRDLSNFHGEYICDKGVRLVKYAPTVDWC